MTTDGGVLPSRIGVAAAIWKIQVLGTACLAEPVLSGLLPAPRILFKPGPQKICVLKQ